MKIIHLTDSHFGDPKPAFNLHVLTQAFNELASDFASENTYLVLSGDISYQGSASGYSDASKFLQDTWLKHSGARERFIACPGNHDICNNKFDEFDRFVFGIRRDHSLTFEKKASHVVEFDDVVFASINSAHHCDHTYGYVDCNDLRKSLESVQATPKRKVAVLHHPLMGVFREDTSVVRNALQMVSLLTSYNFELLIHGHQHAQSDVVIGANGMKVFSGRSLNFATQGVVNGLAIYSFENEDWHREIRVLSSDASLADGKLLLTIGNK